MAISLLGQGPSFPMNVSTTGGLDYTKDIARINQSLYLLFETPKGSRLNMPDFGSDIGKFRFDPLDDILVERLRIAITEDIKKWEPRITLTNIEFLRDSTAIDNSTLYISIYYNLINAQVSGNYVYPYRLETYDTEDYN